MLMKIYFILATLFCCECAYLYSSFWAPLFNPRILNYRVDLPFDPDAGKNLREEYSKNYGVRGEKLISEFGNGKGPSEHKSENKEFGEVKFYYTYKGANKDENTYLP